MRAAGRRPQSAGTAAVRWHQESLRQHSGAHGDGNSPEIVLNHAVHEAVTNHTAASNTEPLLAFLCIKGFALWL